MKKITGFTLALVLLLSAFSLISCTQTEPLATISEPWQEIIDGEKQINVEISYGEQKEPGLYPAEFIEGLTAFDALQQIAEDAGFTVEASDSQYGKYIQAINGVKEDGTNFWLFSLNGAMAQQSADRTSLNPGDSVTFSFGAM